ncbi:MAG: transcriptional regulator, AraC family [Herbinix sp.]|jgi:AraC family transcriptional regulator of arabinose operon|nr:transcriptional regulator, AraC family [Herbinix sp.]
MKINKIGLNYTHSNQFSINRPIGSNDYLFLNLKTPAVFVIEGKEIYAEKNSVIVFSKGTPQQYFAHGGSYTNDFIHFDVEGERDLRNLPLNTLLVLPSSKQLNKIIKEIYLEYISNNSNRYESMDLLLKLLFVKINELVAYKPKDTILYGYYDTLLNLRSLIYRHPEEKWTVERLAHQVNLSPSHFQRLYKQTFGTTCIADVIACKIQYARTSLAATGGTVREIAAMCGYENEEHFMRQFKREVGLTPTEYRKQMR